MQCAHAGTAAKSRKQAPLLSLSGPGEWARHALRQRRLDAPGLVIQAARELIMTNG